MAPTSHDTDALIDESYPLADSFSSTLPVGAVWAADVVGAGHQYDHEITGRFIDRALSMNSTTTSAAA